MPGNSYRYQPLNDDRREIRVLTVLPGNWDEPIQCHLSTVSLLADPKYDALSYVWGAASTESGQTSVLLDDQSFEVTPNLQLALQSLRPFGQSDPLLLWADAICINQQDIAERSKQVAIMRDIYASAAQVTIWLGEADEESDAAFDAMPTIAAQQPFPVEGDIDDHSSTVRRRCGDFFMNLSDCRPWFSRTWILQELAKAKSDPVVVCGAKMVTWSTLVGAWRVLARDILSDFLAPRPKILETTSTVLFNDADGLERFGLTKLDVLDTLRQSSNGVGLHELLFLSRTSMATDPRDRIYGLVGMLEPNALNPDVGYVIPIDYGKSCIEVYTDAMAHMFSRGEGPAFLSQAFLPGLAAPAPLNPLLGPVEEGFLPSWVPDFTRQVPGRRAQAFGSFSPPATGNGGASGAGIGANNGRRLGDTRTLRVEGLVVDVVNEVVPLGATLQALVEDLANLEFKASAARQRPCQFDPSIANLMQSFKVSEPLWRILISNKQFNSGYDPAPASYETSHISLMQQHSTRTEKVANSADSKQSEYELCLQSCVGRKSLFITESGFVGTCVPDTRGGDIVVIIFGSPTPFVLRPIMHQNEHQIHALIGSSYVGGIMAGEIVNELYCEDLVDSTTFLIQ